MSAKHTAKGIVNELKSLSDVDVAAQSQGYFKTAKGEYGEGDIFLGIRMPVLRQQVKIFEDTSLEETENLLHSINHEARLLAVLMLVDQFKRGTKAEQKAVYECYLNTTHYINNWDIVDSSAHLIVGPFLEGKSHKILHKLVKSKSLWERRIAIMSTFHFIRQKDFATALDMIEALIEDKEDLIHKASGWMLREVGNRDRGQEENFLQRYYKEMPRTMLRYAIEKFPEERRQLYLKGKI